MGISFLRQCFTLDPVKRPSAEDLLNHPWMQSLRAELAGVEPPTADTREHAGEPQIARQAHILEERQVADILDSPGEQDPRAQAFNK
jgi:mitogen-activated protein kinase kinase kinase